MNEDETVPGTIIPQRFLPGLGHVAIRFAYMDGGLNEAIWCLAGMDHAAGTAVLMGIPSFHARAVILQRLIALKVPNPDDQAHFIATAEQAICLSEERNALFHHQPYFYSPSADEVGYFRTAVLTNPQIKASPPTTVSPQRLDQIAYQMLRVSVWLDHLAGEASWRDDGDFPWPDKLERARKRVQKNCEKDNGEAK